MVNKMKLPIKYRLDTQEKSFHEILRYLDQVPFLRPSEIKVDRIENWESDSIILLGNSKYKDIYYTCINVKTWNIVELILYYVKLAKNKEYLCQNSKE